ncbi:MAG: hypothetical protein U0575_05805 [Phycisphaerales bacterium]
MTRILHVAAIAALAPVVALADVVAIVANKDNTLIEDPQGDLSLGAAYNFYVGRTGSNAGGTRRRGVVRFDVASAVPAGSTIVSVTLKLRMTQTNSGSQTILLKRMLADWGEAGSFGFGGGGVLALPGDATWLHQFYSNDPWDTPGGVFSATASASKSVGGQAFYTWGSTAGMVGDVQSWLNSPATNFGWLVQGNEAQLNTAKKFESRESTLPEYRPLLTITFTPPPTCVDADINCDGVVDGADLGLLLGVWGTGNADGDLDHSGTVDGADLGLLLGAWTAVAAVE